METSILVLIGIAVMPITSHPAGSLSNGVEAVVHQVNPTCDKPVTADMESQTMGYKMIRIHSDCCKWQILEFPLWMMYDSGSPLKGVPFKRAQTVYIGPSTPISASLNTQKHTKTHPADHGIRSVMLQNHQVCRTSVWPQVSA